MLQHQYSKWEEFFSFSWGKLFCSAVSVILRVALFPISCVSWKKNHFQQIHGRQTNKYTINKQINKFAFVSKGFWHSHGQSWCLFCWWQTLKLKEKITARPDHGWQIHSFPLCDTYSTLIGSTPFGHFFTAEFCGFVPLICSSSIEVPSKLRQY